MNKATRNQAKSGLRLGIAFGLFLIGGMLLSAGMGRVAWSAIPPHYVVWSDPIGWAEIALAAVALLSSAGIWWQLFAGYMLFGFVKSAIVLATGRDIYAPHAPFPRPEAAALGFFCVVSILLMYRFTKNRPAILDRIALTAYLFCLVWRADAAKFSDFDLGLLVGLGCLLLAWAYDRFHHHHRTGHASRPDHVTV